MGPCRPTVIDNFQRDNFPFSIILLQLCELNHAPEFPSRLHCCLLHSSQKALGSNVTLNDKAPKSLFPNDGFVC
jgi:hypothetical protein